MELLLWAAHGVLSAFHAFQAIFPLAQLKLAPWRYYSKYFHCCKALKYTVFAAKPLILSIPFIHSSEPKEPHKVLIKKQRVTSNHSPFALIVSEFRHPEPMQIAVCINGHRLFTAQFKNSAGGLPRIQIADLPAVLSLHKNPLNIVRRILYAKKSFIYFRIRYRRTSW